MKVNLDLSAMPLEELFEWTNGTTIYKFRISVMHRFLKDNPEYADSIHFTVIIEPDFAENCIAKARGVDMDRINSLTKERLSEPVIGCTLTDGSVLLVDGNHRYMRRYLDGYKTVDYFLFPESLW